MKILFVAPWVPGQVRPRSAVLARLAAEQHDVRILALSRHAREAASAEALKDIAPVTLIANPKIASLGRVALGMFSSRPLQSAYADVPAFSRMLASELSSFQPDLVHLNVLRTAHLLPQLAGLPVLCDLDELRSRYFDQLAGSGGTLAWRLGARIEGPRASALERRVLSSHATVAVSSPEDAGPETGAVLVRTPLDVDYWNGALREGPADRPTLLFVGRLHYQANVDAITWFLDSCLPALRERHPSLRLLIVGEAPPKAITSRASDAVEVVGDVDDLRPFYAKSDVAIVPVRAGTGVQMKLIQAMAAGTPAVVTRAAADRAWARDGEHCLAAREPEEWVAAIDSLLRDPSRRRSLARSALDWVTLHHGLDGVRSQLQAAYHQAFQAIHETSLSMAA